MIWTDIGKVKVSPLERAYQMKSLAQSECYGCRELANILMLHPDAVRLQCTLCKSAYEPDRPWARLLMPSLSESDGQ